MFSRLPLSYCTNVHPGRTVAEVEQGLDRFTVPVSRRYGGELAAGLWLAQRVVREMLTEPAEVERFAASLRQRGLSCHTLNAFPYGDFHSARVKENVYRPDWSEPQRLEYTRDCARILAAFLPPDSEGSISTVPLGFKGFGHPADFMERSIRQLIQLAKDLQRLYGETGKRIRLAIEPEPLCVLETTDETILFFERLREEATRRGAAAAVTEFIGACYDVCHQAVEFEDVAASIRSLADAEIRINKVHITCALQVERPAENEAARRALAGYIEPRYLHQTFALSGRDVLRAVDLTEDLAMRPEPAFRDAAMWRIHFHVPVDAERMGPLGTTRDELRRALAAVAELDYAPHLEVETYTWKVLPDQADLVEGLARELIATRALLESLSADAS